MESDVLVEARNPYATVARELLTAADLTSFINGRHKARAGNVLHQIALGRRELEESRPIEELTLWICGQMEETVKRHHSHYVVFCMPQMPEKRFVSVCANVWRNSTSQPNFDFANTVTDAVTRIIQRLANAQSKPEPSFPLDTVPGMDSLTADLRDNASGRVAADKVADLFGIKLTTLANAVGISKQGLAQTPDSVKAQPVLRLFERIARLRSHPQFTDPTALRKWFRQPLPIFSNHAAEELFEAGKLSIVAAKVDQMLTGDFGG